MGDQRSSDVGALASLNLVGIEAGELATSPGLNHAAPPVEARLLYGIVLGIISQAWRRGLAGAHVPHRTEMSSLICMELHAAASEVLAATSESVNLTRLTLCVLPGTSHRYAR